ncbi:serine/threonine protein phosphatase [Bradyrhizobium sp. INPA01-394B]|uniref:Serine/threonine protein phosphatase n=1 Tax=Bradyrhizobium campsiandrae TaxID=1729892 RepID=A0ABR7U6T5_9BRAD|nr:metallophosphoesterase family protein [Bradyrhizobium campsiandrae]MBC9876937.1 serine/threonine protein phosphatase [Bradyrhizobium campsiandrae]MBC9877000.1 serine/threonine protein phosphatase [Bradyrhizobium campsiandrae]MBC9979736.1 serine/threonine protein phosphatase [Bradyrhizobium campsiandrae]
MITLPSQNSPRPKLPNGVRIYALTDIHGCAHLLEQMFAVIDADMANSRPYRAIEVFLGDYIDRGPDSRRTLDLLIQRSRYRNTVFLKGNHEAYFTAMLDDPSRAADWLQFGGLQTLMSYGISAPPDLGEDEQADLVRELISAMPPQHIAFLRQLRPTFTCGDFFFVHAGVRPGIPLSEQREQDLLWIRDEFLQSKKRFGKYVVHGHTPVRQAELLENRANIDTGAYATGNLTLLSIQGDSMLAI